MYTFTVLRIPGGYDRCLEGARKLGAENKWIPRGECRKINLQFCCNDAAVNLLIIVILALSLHLCTFPEVLHCLYVPKWSGLVLGVVFVGKS